MITYTKEFGGFPLIFRVTGTSWPNGIIPGLVSLAISFALGVCGLEETMRNRELWMDHPYPFQLFAFIVGFLIVFRTNFAYARYWEARGVVAQMGSKWLDGACMAVAFDAPGSSRTPYLEGTGASFTADTSLKVTPNGCVSHEDFVAQILHLFSLMHALAMQHVRGDDDLDNLHGFSLSRARGESDGSNLTSSPSAILNALPEKPVNRMWMLPGWTRHRFHNVHKQMRLYIIGDLSPEERAALEGSAGHPIPTEARVTMVEGWIMRRLIARQKFEKSGSTETSPPILSRLYQVISDGCIGFGQASKFTDTPFPFPYQNLLQVFLWIYVCTVPLLMNAWLHNLPLRFAMTFIAVWCYFALHQVGNNLEDPFLPYDHNELALQHIQHSYNAKLLSYVPVPDHLYEPAASPALAAAKLEALMAAVPAPSLLPATKAPEEPLPGEVTKETSTRHGGAVRLAIPAAKAQDADATKGKRVKKSVKAKGLNGQDAVTGVKSSPPGGAGHGPPEASVDSESEAKMQNDPSLQALTVNGVDALGPMVRESLQELATAQTRCLRLVGMLEGALAHSDAQGQLISAGTSPGADPGSLPGAVVASVETGASSPGSDKGRIVATTSDASFLR